MPTSKKKKTSTSKKETGADKAKKQPKKASAKDAEAKKASPAPGAEQEVRKDSFAKTLLLQTVPLALLLLAVLLLFCLLSPGHMGLFGTVMQSALLGLFGGGGYLIPILLAVIALLFKKDADRGTAGLKFIYASGICLLVSVLLQLWAYPGNPHTFDVAAMWKNGISRIGGGALGGLLGEGIHVVFGAWGTPLIAIVGILILTLLLLNLTPYTIWHAISARFRAQREEMARREEEAREEEALAKQKRYVFRSATTEDGGKRHLRQVREPEPPTGRHAIQVPIDAAEASSAVGNGGKSLGDSPTDGGTTYSPTPAHETNSAVLGDDVAISIYGKAKQSSAESAETESDAPAPEDDSAPWEEPMEGEQLSPIRIRKKPNPLENDGSAQASIEELESVISDDVMASFKERQKDRPEGGEVDEHGLITSVDTLTGEVMEEGEDEFSLAIRRLSAMEGILPAENRIDPIEEKPYELPPVTLLREGESNREADVSEELNTNAARLVDTLKSFRVRTRIVAISRGPVITRYELAPEEGVKVRSIANLVDDIALNLATTGVRIEAPIPGKSAVGVEVPNKTVEIVALRDLLDSPKFKGSSSLIMAALGMDVAGAPIYLDIAKMPHLLIAGPTGSGKPVCINCMLVSLLFRATPDQVKLIMIDPKKVELNIYNGLPHLLVPVVSDPKKAAGALHWAVTEMERRFELIEAAGVRDLKHYNALAEDDPSKEFLPQIVIVIDELADLMMTSRDEVETSICRIAQKARAAGMHLIIGTQRPSVNVVTGVIKANIPSRIAFRVAGQADSRVILDMNGAEKLIGNGDMLYAPVGCPKPIRVQGAFVSSEEVDEIVAFIKEQGKASYDASVISSIDEAAERCGSKRGGSDELGGDDAPTENDPMLKKAIELAVESGKISTSLIQRRLSLGYGRAAKLIDRMESMGIVGAPEGQKPRQVLITSDQYLEMIASGFGDDFS